MYFEDIYNKILQCVCGSKSFIEMTGYLNKTTEIVCAKCLRTAKYSIEDE